MPMPKRKTEDQIFDDVIQQEEEEEQAAIEEMAQRLVQSPRFDISNEAWREYVYPDGSKLHVTGAITLILDKHPSGNDRHRLILEDDDGQVGMYIKPGWLGIAWQAHDKTHGINF